MNWLYERIKNNVYIKNEDQLVYSMTLCALSVVIAILHVIFLIVHVTSNIPELTFMNLTSLVGYLYVIRTITRKSNIVYVLYVSLLLIIYYVLWTSYFVGYEKYAIIILPVLVTCLYNIYKVNEKHLIIMTILVILSCFILMYFRYNVSSKYEGRLMYIEIINIVYAFSAGLFTLYANKLSYLYLKKYDIQEVERLSKEANIDFLTGLWNRRYVSNKFDKGEMNNSCVVLADVDFFKKINDTYGHDVGDYILKQISKVFVNEIKEPSIVCRWGGEEFLIILKEGSKKLAIDKLESLRLLIADTIFKYNDEKIRLTISFGVRYVMNDDAKFEEAIKHADEALYFSKDNGRNQVTLYDDISTKSLRIL